MIGRNSECFDGLTVLFGGVSLVAKPVVLRILLGQLVHIVVTIGLGKDRGCRDGEELAITLDNGRMRKVTIRFEAVAVDNDGFRAHLKLVEGPMHGQDRGIENVDAVNLLRSDDTYGPSHRIALNDLAQLIALTLSQLFGVVEQFVVLIGGQDDSRSIDAACQTASTRLVAAGFYLSLVIVTLEHDKLVNLL